MEEAIIELINMVREAAPALWDAGLAQVRADIMVGIIWLAGMALPALAVSTYFARKFLVMAFTGNGHVDDDYLVLGLLIAVVAVIALVIAISAFTGIVARLMSPDYYAIQNLMELVVK